MGYLDPGLFGMLSQVGLMLLLVVVSAFTFFFRPIKKFFRRIFKKENQDKPVASSDANEVQQ